MLKATVEHRALRTTVRALCAVIAVCAGAPAAWALNGTPDATVAATTGLACPPNGGAALNCTANDFVASASSTSPTQTPCNEGDILDPATNTGLDILLHISASNATRNDVGFFADEVGKSPNTGGSTGIVPNAGTCSVAAFPTTDADPANQGTMQGGTLKGGGWFDSGGNAGNTCGDHEAGGATDSVITGIKAVCARDATHHLTVPFMLTYAPNNNGTCTGNANVGAGTASKCTVLNASVSNVVVLSNADPACSDKTVSFDPVATTITSVITLVNNNGLNGGPVGDADGTTFTDTIPSPASSINGTPTCTSNDGAVCALDPVNGTTVSGTITTFPNGSHVTITIVANYTAGIQVPDFTNTATLTPSATIQAGADNTENNTCISNPLSLPVKLQKFEVN